MENPLISVIIPIYNVEKYLDECIESITNQTYRNLEIILVDDGATDNCPQKCDEWATRDSRIKVIHKKNGGLSSARNAGLDIATGEYFGFVDSDDVVSTDMFTLLFNALKEHPNASIASGMVLAYDGATTKPFRKNWVIENERLIRYSDFLIKTLDLSVCYTVWNKLYTAEPFKKIRFPEGKNNEDSYYMFELSKVIEKRKLDMIEIPEYVYYYRIDREGSICNDSKKPLVLDSIANYSEFIDYFNNLGDKRVHILYDVYNKFIMYFLVSMLKNKSWRQKYFNEYRMRLKHLSFSDIKRIFKDNRGMYKHYLCIKYFPRLYIMIGNSIF